MDDFNSKRDRYQSELINKTRHARDFLDQPTKVDGWDYRRIEALLDMIV